MSLILYVTSVTHSRETKARQCEVKRIFETRGIKYDSVDISLDKCYLEEMRKKAGDPCAVPPQLCRGDKYIGGYTELVDAVEDGKLEELLAQD
ncbi:SH3 domain-binding glutamic acid-rich-like protein 3 [Leptodactylus fuscus]|uniref:SH3 domain-binding glutamic acid-rich-like protein 3 n=1 Tax=Leptodactylus fuscus TaxID=238119 RepID=UPI003F4E8EF8